MKFLITLLIALCLHTNLHAQTYAIVNGEEINIQEINDFMKNLEKEESYAQLPTDQKNLILHQVIEKKLLIQEAKKAKLDEEKDFKEALLGIKNNLLVEFWMKKSFDEIAISDKEIETYYNNNLGEFKQSLQVKARHIVVEKESDAQAIIKELNSSKADIQKRFIALANEKSIEPQANTRGGDLGWFKQGDMLEEFWQEAIGLEENGYSQKPLKTMYGYHVVFLDGKQPAFTIKLEQVHNNIKTKLKMARFQNIVDEKIKSIKKNAQITVIK